MLHHLPIYSNKEDLLTMPGKYPNWLIGNFSNFIKDYIYNSPGVVMDSFFVYVYGLRLVALKRSTGT